ncbi:MAG TPA: RluA family pseudouridine synthase [Longimicrobiaceae bacterium]|nr:RluA family pseudouridine synthase [Longimicrobiaceae bacterium]
MTPARPTDARRWREHTVAPEEAGRTVEAILTGPMQLSRRMIQRLTRSRGIQLNRRAAFLARQVRAGDVVAVRVAPEEETGLEPVAMELEVVYEDADVLVVAKPPGLLVHPTSPGQARTLAHGIAHRYREQGVRARVRPVHRIDRDTSGLVLVAKTAFAHQHLDRQLRERTLRREYLALVRGVVEEDGGVVDAPIGRDRRNPNLRTVHPGGEPALTRFRVVERFRAATLLRLELETGRTHQIRVHLAHLGHPVLGDRQYGGTGTEGMGRQALHASRLRFRQPTTGEEVVCEAPLPPDMATAVERLRSG